MQAIGFPSRYRQGAGLLDELGAEAARLGRRPLVLCDTFVRGAFGPRVEASLGAANLRPAWADFAGECSPSAIEAAVGTARRNGCDAVVGMGGGKAIDTGKGVSIETGLPMIVVPTVASNDSPVSRLAITYEDDGTFIGPRLMARNPDAVLVDTAVIAAAPTRFLVAGIGDALVTMFEAEQCAASGAETFFGARPTQTGLALARACHDVVRAHGPEAVRDVDADRVTEAVERVTEANVLLSGLGFEGCGVAAAHAIGMAFTLLPAMKGVLHGEEVAVGLMAQFALEGRDDAFMDDVRRFYSAVRLPTSLRDLGIDAIADAEVEAVAAFAARPGSRLHNMSFPVDAGMVRDAIREVGRRA